MTRSKLLKKMCDLYPFMIRRDINKILTLIFYEITEALREGRRIEIRHFGSYRLVKRKARMGRNPKTGEKNIQIPEKKAIKWKISKSFFNRLNKNFTENKISDTH